MHILNSKSVFTLELKKTLSKRNIIAILVFAALLQFFLQVGRNKYIDILESRKSLQSIERAKVSQYSLYRQYGSFGITFMFISPNLSVLYSDPIFEGLLSNVNTGSRLEIYKTFKGRNFFIDKSGGYLNFMGIFLLFGVFFGMVYGREATSSIKYSKFLASISPPGKLFWATVFSRLSIINLAFVVLAIISVLPLFIYKINLFQSTFALIILGIIMVVSVSFTVGCIIGGLKRKIKIKKKKELNRSVVTLVVYLISVALIPLLFNFYTQVTANDIEPLFDFDFANLKTIMSGEKRLIAKYGVLELGETPSPEVVEEVWKAFNNEFKKILEKEEKLKDQVLKKIKKRQFISSLFPFLFYFTICEDVTSQGGISFVDFHTFSISRKDQFIEYCFKKIYSGRNRPPDGHIESFIKDNEDLFIAKSRSPNYLWLGVITSVLFISVFLSISFRMFLNRVLKSNPGKIRDFEFNIETSKFNYLLTADEGLKNQVYNFYSGSGFTSLNIKIDGEDSKQEGFIWLCNPLYIADELDENTLYKALYGKKPVETGKTWEIIFRFALENSKDRVIILDNFFKGLKFSESRIIIESIRKTGTAALYIGENIYEGEKLADNLIFSEKDQSIDAIIEVLEVVKKH